MRLNYPRVIVLLLIAGTSLLIYANRPHRPSAESIPPLDISPAARRAVAASTRPATKPATIPVTQVKLDATAEGLQPSGWPVVVDVTMTNTGTAPVSWWCGGPGTYPGAEHFKIEIRMNADQIWHEVSSTNGQGTQGSGTSQNLAPGESIHVPLAIPAPKGDGIRVRIVAPEWPSTQAAEIGASISDRREIVDRRQTSVIQSVLKGDDPFMKHLAQRYADAVVLDAMLKMVTVDNQPLVSASAEVLWTQKSLPKSESDHLAVVVNRWLSRTPSPEWGGLQQFVAEAALKTEGESARAAVLERLKFPESRDIAMNALHPSPGDVDWLRRARAAISEVPVESDSKTIYLKWLDSRISHPDE